MTAALAETAFSRVCNALTAAGCTPRGNEQQRSARCPAHDDKNPSLSITRGDDRVLIRCHSGCSTDRILDALGLTTPDLFDTALDKMRNQPAVVAEYDYVDEHGTVLFVVERRVPKTFRQRKPDGQGGWTWKLGDTRRVLYRLPQVLEAVSAGRTVYVAEGEKDVHALEKAGVVATCNAGGAGKWRDEYTESLRAANVIVVADRDDTGRRHAADVATRLRTAGTTVTVVEPKEGKDASDHLAAGHSLDELAPRPQLEVLDGGIAAGATSIGVELVDWNDLFTKPRQPTRWYAWPILAAGRVTTIYSPGKTGKSLLAMEAAARTSLGGGHFLGRYIGEPAKGLYIDQEMTPEDWLDRLTDMGVTASDVPALTERLHLAQLQPWPPMDTLAGGSMVLAVAEAVGASYVIIDTVSKVMAGEENSNDSHGAFYRNTVVPLKRAGLAVLVLDHTGKDIDRGARGGSAKTDNVDLAYELLLRGRDTLSLKPSHIRFRDDSIKQGESIFIKRETEPFLVHTYESADERTEDLVELCLRQLRAWPVEPDDPGSKVMDGLRKYGKKYRTETFYEAWRRFRQENGWAE